ETVLVPRPSYPLFDYLAALESARVAAYSIVYDGRWSLDLTALERALAAAGPEAPRAVVLVNPNNPTGSALRRSERLALEALCAPRAVPLISDEVFFDYLETPPDGPGSGDPIVSLASPITPAAGASIAGPSGGRSPGLAAPTFTLGGMSKACGLPQMKLGWIIVGGPEEAAAEALARLDLVADTYLSVGAPVQRAAARLLDLGDGIRDRIRLRVRENRAHLAAVIGPASSCRLLESDGGWSAVVRVPAVVPEEDLVLRLLQEDGVLVHPGYFFDFPREAHLVLSLLPEPGTFREAVRRILGRVER
ncbi:MAG TPA: pyridoxal phosphate-dependent aminotransferase, partial [Candidatus Polarisedimenticolia bacterium]|nr:pyridoxal phosphate-dependent aminotransferase [Candidatus Polarisedimenticolia bacterium]